MASRDFFQQLEDDARPKPPNALDKPLPLQTAARG
jgi:hypothetical protein